jgi:hypothetical protein
MRTTLTLDDRLLADLKQLSLDSGRPLKVVVNETLQAGLKGQQSTRKSRYRLQPVAMGKPLFAGDLNKALRIADEIEDTVIISKLEQGK